LDIYASYHT